MKRENGKIFKNKKGKKDITEKKIEEEKIRDKIDKSQREKQLTVVSSSGRQNPASQVQGPKTADPARDSQQVCGIL